MPKTPSTRTKIVFWIIWGVLSAYFAESLSASQPFAIVNPVNILLLVPLYGLHSIILATLVFRYSKPRLYPLFFAGAIFGLYEAYITKVLWDPPWGALFKLGGIAVFSTGVLVLWWHVFIAFIIPLIVLEEQATSSHSLISGLPPRIRSFLSKRRNLFILAAAAGVVQGSSGAETGPLLLANLISPPILFLIIWQWKKRNLHLTRLEDLLPNTKQLRWLIGILGLIYLVLGLLMRPEALPGLAPQIMVWLMYGFFISLLVISMNRSKNVKVKESVSPLIETSTGFLITLWAILIVSSLLVSLLPFKEVLALLHWLLGTLFGVLILFLAIKDAYQILSESRQGDKHAAKPTNFPQ